MKIHEAKNKSTLILYVLITIVIYSLMFLMIENKAFSMLIATIIVSTIILLRDIKKNIMALLFTISYTSFLVGRPFLQEIMHINNESLIQYDDQTKSFVYATLTVSFILIIVSYYLTKQIKKKKTQINSKHVDEISKVKVIRAVTSVTTIIFYLSDIIKLVVRLSVIKEVGYTASYTYQLSSQVPAIINILSQLAPISFYLYLSTLPSKKESRIIILIYLLSNILMLICGNRLEIVTSVLLLLTYYIWRNDTDKTPWINKRKLIILALATPILLSGLQFVSYKRDNLDSQNSNPIIGLIGGIGGSSQIIGAVKKDDNNYLDENVKYSFGNIYRSIRGNIISKLLDEDSTYKTQTIEMAKEGHSLSSAITYHYYPNRYLRGYGLGSCYIAELYHDFSWLGIIIGSILIGIAIAFTEKIENNKVLKNYFIILMISSLLRIPRDSFDIYIEQLISIKNILFIVTVVIVTKIVLSKQKMYIKEKN